MDPTDRAIKGFYCTVEIHGEKKKQMPVSVLKMSAGPWPAKFGSVQQAFLLYDI